MLHVRGPCCFSCRYLTQDTENSFHYEVVLDDMVQGGSCPAVIPISVRNSLERLSLAQVMCLLVL